ncbi:MAG TPA: chemotaxis-specific protein-glutamate methyltransferase CheB [Bryobacteraceae bacterium]|jgi:two-component system chemotaxis response regulator CheB
MTPQTISVLVADDSQVARMLLVHLLESDPQIRIAGAVSDGREALDFVRGNKPDVILMDLHMPHLNGFEATRLIMETQPVPIVICSGTTDIKEASTAFRTMEAGAVACVQKPVARDHLDFDRLGATLLETVKLMSEVKVVRRWPVSRSFTSGAAGAVQVRQSAAAITIVGIGASTGGPPVLQTILSNLPRDFAGALLIVQHVARGFLPGMIDWLNQTAGLPVHIASHGVFPLPGHAYLAPDDFHMGVGAGGRIVLTDGPPENGLRPAVAHLFNSLAVMCGPNAVGVLLTGMGRDGAAELKLMRNAGAVTIAQDRETSVVNGMPGAAVELNAAIHVLPLDRIAPTILTLVNRRQLFREATS